MQLSFTQLHNDNITYSSHQEHIQGCHMVRKTKKNDKSQEIFFLNIRFFQFKFTKFIIFKSLRMVKN